MANERMTITGGENVTRKKLFMPLAEYFDGKLESTAFRSSSILHQAAEWQ
jgi:hypothetical protein